ncbi:MAG: hypothetical protein ACXVFA_10045 [Solirubrobacteraceae bacterium]
MAAVAGAVFFALFLAFAALTSGTPSITASGQDTFNYLSAHHERLQLAAVVMGLAMPAALLFVSGLFRALRKAEGGIAGGAVAALGGGVLAAAASVTGALIVGITANRITEIGPSGAHIWWTMYLMSLGATLLGLLLLIGTTAVISLRTHLFARWFAIASVPLALLSIAGAFAIGYATTAVLTVAGIAVILDSVWILLVSIYLWRDPTLALPSG